MDHLLTLLRAAAEDTRLRILALAAREDLTVSDYVHVLVKASRAFHAI